MWGIGGNIFISLTGGSPEFIAECTETLKSWALSVDISRKFIDTVKLRSQREINLGGGGYVHLISLAMHRDVERLNTFIKQMDDAGEDKFILTTTIRREVVERAIQLAQDESFPRPDFIKPL